MSGCPAIPVVECADMSYTTFHHLPSHYPCPAAHSLIHVHCGNFVVSAAFVSDGGTADHPPGGTRPHVVAHLGGRRAAAGNVVHGGDGHPPSTRGHDASHGGRGA